MLDLRTATDPRWVSVVLADFGPFLVDHAACERKAFSTGLSLVSRFPDRVGIIEPLLDFAREELEHFQLVYRLLAARGLRLQPDSADEYARGLLAFDAPKHDEVLLHRLLVAGVIEARSCERLRLLADALVPTDPELGAFYLDLARSEARHHGLFFRLARQEFDEARVRDRAARLLDHEAGLVQRLPLRAAVH